MQRNPHSYQIATGYRTFYSLSLIYQPITKKRLFFGKKSPSDYEITGISQETYGTNYSNKRKSFAFLPYIVYL